jgi:hypothetical protein
MSMENSNDTIGNRTRKLPTLFVLLVSAIYSRSVLLITACTPLYCKFEMALYGRHDAWRPAFMGKASTPTQ